MAIALDRVRYFATRLSDNIAETPEGYRLCKNAVIARTGFQGYKVSELTDPAGILADRAPHEELDIWRDPAEVFSPATLASFEGKTFTLTHPDDLLDPDTERDHHEGHVTNVRKGPEALDDGNYPVLADILVTGRDAIRAIDAGFRELSCGYSYRLAKEGYRYDQRDIRGNHVALVQKGRAGAEARIHDAAPAEEPIDMNILKNLFGKGFTLAKDAKAEDIAAVSRIVALDESPGNTEEEKKPEPKFIQIGTTADGVAIFKLSTAKDAEMEAPAMDRRKRMHDMLDAMMSAEEEKEKMGAEQKDADLGELKRLLNQTLGEGGQEPGEEKDAEPHAEGCDCKDCMAKGKDGQEHEREEREGNDAEIVNAEPVIPASERQQGVFDAKQVLSMFNALKPFVAKAKDKKLIAAFDMATQSIRATMARPKEGKRGGYGEFTQATSHIDSDRVEKAKDAIEGEHGATGWKPRQTSAEAAAAAADEIYRKDREARKTSRVGARGRV